MKISKDHRISRPPEAAAKGSAGRRRRQSKDQPAAEGGGSKDQPAAEGGSQRIRVGRRKRRPKDQPVEGGLKDRSKTASKDQTATNTQNKLKRYCPVVPPRTDRDKSIKNIFNKNSVCSETSKNEVFQKTCFSKDQNFHPFLRFPPKKTNNGLTAG